MTKSKNSQVVAKWQNKKVVEKQLSKITKTIERKHGSTRISNKKLKSVEMKYGRTTKLKGNPSNFKEEANDYNLSIFMSEEICISY